MTRKRSMMKGLIVGIIVFIGINTMASPSVLSAKNSHTISFYREGSTLYVGGTGPNNYTRIRDAVSASHDGDTVFVYSGIYYENIDIYHPLSLLGEDKNTTIIDGQGMGAPVYIDARNVLLQGFTIRNSGDEIPPDGVHLVASYYCTITGNIIEYNKCGVSLGGWSFYNNIVGNIIRGCQDDGISFDAWSMPLDRNIVAYNVIQDNDNGIHEESHYSFGITFNQFYNNTIINNTIGFFVSNMEEVPQTCWNRIYHNLFIRNGIQAVEYMNDNYWDNGYPSGGNYWSDYLGADQNHGPGQNQSGSDGIGDTPYTIYANGVDRYPLMGSSPPGGPDDVDPHRSAVTLTNENSVGLLTCPAGDGGVYQYVKVTCRNITGAPLSGIPADEVRVIPSSCPGASSCVFTAVDNETNETGDIRFEVGSVSSIAGNISIHVFVTRILLDNIGILPAKSFDLCTDGTVNIADFVTFAQDYSTTSWRSDFSWDGIVSLADFAMFAHHYRHHG